MAENHKLGHAQRQLLINKQRLGHIANDRLMTATAIGRVEGYGTGVGGFAQKAAQEGCLASAIRSDKHSRAAAGGLGIDMSQNSLATRLYAQVLKLDTYADNLAAGGTTQKNFSKVARFSFIICK